MVAGVFYFIKNGEIIDMCGITAYLGNTYGQKELEPFLNRIKYRGPDNTRYQKVADDVLFGFHRLAIMGITEAGDQPMSHPEDAELTLICNGEIYNYRQLAQKYGLALKTGSDCEVILFMYKTLGIQRTVAELDGVFMFVLHDGHTGILFASRDPFGVRPGFIGWENDNIMISSEAKTMVGICDHIFPFPPGTLWTSTDREVFQCYYHFTDPMQDQQDEKQICNRIRDLLISAVEKRLMAEREIGCLLSGGLDSSLISALVAKTSGTDHLKTFSIGLKGSTDLDYAQMAADHIGTSHHNIECAEKTFLAAVETVIYNIESYDTTTVRASIGNYLVSKYILENTDCKVIFTGDGSDEVCCGYWYLKNAPSFQELQAESKKLVEEIHYFDVLRADRSISSNGLEARTPFLDKAFVDYYFSIPAELKAFDGVTKLEKYLLRKAFDGMGLLPDNILWRRKCAFSDGVSTMKRSWHHIIQDFVDRQISDEEYQRNAPGITHCTPVLKESYYYRKVYEQFFGKHVNLIPHFWMPKWTTVSDPSARELEGYEE